jgi:hypothetical protein
MSIYRKFDHEPLSDVHAKPVRHAADNPPATAAQRQGEAASEPFATTLQWAATLPSDVRPMHLLRQFPRIANFLAAAWDDPAALRPYLDELFVDRRGNRKGFPPDIMGELFALRAYYEALHPATGRRWDDSMRHR